MRPCVLPHQKPDRFTRIVILFALAFIPATITAQPQEVPATTVAACNFIDTIQGSSGFGKNYDWKSIAKAQALKLADEKGATHVVWDTFNPVGAFNGIAVAKVYKCNS